MVRINDDIDEIKKCFDKNVIEPFNDNMLARMLFVAWTAMRYCSSFTALSEKS